MDVIRDCIGRVVCKGDATTGEIESAYRRHKTKARLAVGETLTVEREGVVTCITRVSTEAFKVESPQSLSLAT